MKIVSQKARSFLLALFSKVAESSFSQTTIYSKVFTSNSWIVSPSSYNAWLQYSNHSSGISYSQKNGYHNAYPSISNQIPNSTNINIATWFLMVSLQIFYNTKIQVYLNYKNFFKDDIIKYHSINPLERN